MIRESFVNPVHSYDGKLCSYRRNVYEECLTMQKMVHEIRQDLRYMINTVIKMHIYIHSQGKVWFDKYPNANSIFFLDSEISFLYAFCFKS